MHKQTILYEENVKKKTRMGTYPSQKSLSPANSFLTLVHLVQLSSVVVSLSSTQLNSPATLGPTGEANGESIEKDEHA